MQSSDRIARHPISLNEQLLLPRLLGTRNFHLHKSEWELLGDEVL
jgi:hypothetical protein